MLATPVRWPRRPGRRGHLDGDRSNDDEHRPAGRWYAGPGGRGQGGGGATKNAAKALPDISWRILLLVVIVLACLLAATLVIVFHYPKAGTTTSVLGVVIPVFTALIGAALGTGAGAVAGAAGKKTSDQQLATANQKLSTIHQQAKTLQARQATVFGAMKTGLASPAGQARLVAESAPGQASATIDIADLDAAATALTQILTISQPTA